MAKKKIFRVFVLVLVICFVWVAQVDAANVTVDNEDVFYSIFKNAELSNSAPFSFINFDCEYDGELLSFPAIYSNGTPSASGLSSQHFYFNGITFDMFDSGDVISFSFILIPFSVSYGDIDFDKLFSYFDILLRYSDGTDVTLIDKSITQVSIDLIVDNLSATYNAFKIDFSFTLSDSDYYLYFLGNYMLNGYRVRIDSFALGVLVPYVSYGLTNEEKQILQQILLGVDNANAQLADIQSEQSSYYEDLKTPESENVSAVESMESARQEGQQVVDEYSSLNASLEKPNVDELLPDYDRVVDGYVDTSIFDVFSTLYESGYIMFMLLITVFFGVMSYALFGKKA